MSELLETALMPTDTPKTDALIHRVMRQYPGVSASAQAKYYEEVHQELAPLCRRLEREVAALKTDLRDYMNAANAEARFADELKTERDQLRAELAALRAPVEQAPEWISVEDRLPETDDKVLVTVHGFNREENPLVVTAAAYVDGTWIRGDDEESYPPVHWMLLPAAPSAPGREG